MRLIATFLLLGITQTHAEYPALQAVLTQKGLQKGKMFHFLERGDKKRNHTDTKGP